MSFFLKLLGGATLTSGTGPVTGPAVQRHRLALLALLATARAGALSRDKLLGWLWPERDSEPARRLLNQAVHALRQALGQEAILSSGDELRLDPAVVQCDLRAFEEALSGGLPERAVELYGGAFLDGFYLSDAPEFERWVDRERDRLAAAYARALEGLAEAAERAGDAGRAVEWWKVRVGHDPYDSRVALRLIGALERAGNRAGALQHATTHQQLLRDELEIEPGPEVRALVERLRREPPAPAATRERTSEAAAIRPDNSPEAAADTVLAGSERSGPPSPRRSARYVSAVLLLAFAIAGALRLAARSGEAGPTASLDVVDEIAQAVARELERRERGDTAIRLPAHRTRSIPAYEAYLRGDDPALLRSDSGARRGLEHFRRAVELDSTYAAAWVGLARMTVRSSGGSLAQQAEARARAETIVRKALALDSSLAEAHVIFGMFRARAADFATAERHFRRAISLEPTQARLRERFVRFLLMTGRTAEALVQAERAVALDPLSPSATAELARALGSNDRCEEALARLKSIAGLDPPLLRVPGIAARCHARMGRWAEAIALLETDDDGRDDPGRLALLGYVHGRAGHREEALSIQARLLEGRRQGTIAAMDLAFVPAAVGNRDEAFTWLDRAHEDGSLRSVPGEGIGPDDLPFDVLKQDPRMDLVRVRLGAQKR